MMHPSSSKVDMKSFHGRQICTTSPLPRCYSQIQEVLEEEEEVYCKTQLITERAVKWIWKEYARVCMFTWDTQNWLDFTVWAATVGPLQLHQDSRRIFCDGVKANVDFFAFSSSSRKGWPGRIGTWNAADYIVAFPFEPQHSVSSLPHPTTGQQHLELSSLTNLQIKYFTSHSRPEQENKPTPPQKGPESRRRHGQDFKGTEKFLIIDK